MNKFLTLCVACCALSAASVQAQIQTNAGVQYLQCMQKDMSTDFSDLSNTYFLADSLADFNAATGEGQLNWKRYRLSPRQAFNLNGYWPVRMQMLDFPDAAYDNDPNLRMKVSFVSPRCLRIRMKTSNMDPERNDSESPMLCGQVPATDVWRAGADARAVSYTSPYGTLEIQRHPFRLVLKDKRGRILTQTRHIIDNDSSQVKLLPFSFIKRGSDNSRALNPVFTLAPGERIYGCGE